MDEPVHPEPFHAAAADLPVIMPPPVLITPDHVTPPSHVATDQSVYCIHSTSSALLAMYSVSYMVEIPPATQPKGTVDAVPPRDFH